MANGIKKAFQTGRQNYNKLGLLKKAKDVAFDGGKKNKSKKPQSKTATKKQTTTAPVSIPAGHTKLNKQNAPSAPKEIPAGTKFYDAEGRLHRWEGNMWTTLNDRKKWQSGIIDNKTAFSQFLDAVKQNKAFVAKNASGNNTQPNRPKDQTMKKNVKEGLADMAGKVDKDHEIQMARSDLYKLAEYAIKLHDMLKLIPEEQGIEAWQQAKITKASDYISSVFHSLDYDQKFPPANTGNAGELGEAAAKIACTKCDEVSTAAAWKKNNNFCPKCKTSNQGVAEGKKKYKSDAQRKAVHAAMNAKAKKESADPYLTILRQQLSEKAESKDQQRAAGIALKHKREGTKPPKGSASEEMMKMSTKELEKFAGTKHKGLPKKKTNESLNRQAKKILGEGKEYQIYLKLNEAPTGNVINKIKSGLSKLPSQAASKATKIIKSLPKAALPVAGGIILAMAGGDAAMAGDINADALQGGLEKLQQLRTDFDSNVADMRGSNSGAAQGAAEVTRDQVKQAYRTLGGGDTNTIKELIQNNVDIDKVKNILSKFNVTDPMDTRMALTQIDGDNLKPMIDWISQNK